MQEQTNITHIWPYSKIVNPEAQPFSDERESDVWDELRELTLDDEVRGKICVALHDTLNHTASANAFNHELLRETVANNRVSFYRPREVELNIHRPAIAARSVQPFRSVDEEFALGLMGGRSTGHIRPNRDSCEGSPRRERETDCCFPSRIKTGRRICC